MKSITPIGTFDFDERRTVVFRRGLIGFSKLKKFMIVEHEKYLSFLISLDDANIALPVYFCLFPVYEKAKFDALDELETWLVADIDVYLPVILKAKIEDSTADMNAPLLVCEKTRRGKQAVMLSDHLGDLMMFKEKKCSS